MDKKFKDKAIKVHKTYYDALEEYVRFGEDFIAKDVVTAEDVNELMEVENKIKNAVSSINCIVKMTTKMQTPVRKKIKAKMLKIREEELFKIAADE